MQAAMVRPTSGDTHNVFESSDFIVGTFVGRFLPRAQASFCRSSLGESFRKPLFSLRAKPIRFAPGETNTMTYARTAVSLLLWTTAAGSWVACQSETPPPKGQLMLAVQSDMALPKDVDEVRIEVLVYGNLLFGNTYNAGYGNLTIPATFALVAGKDPTTPVTLRVMGRQKQKTRTLREVITTVPSDRIATLRVPISWFCDGSAKDSASGNVESTCEAGSTCVAGTCVSSKVDSTVLPGFTAETIFGGSVSPATGKCLDVQTCFRNATDVPNIDLASCSVRLATAVGAGMNFALRTTAETTTRIPPAAVKEGDGVCAEDKTNCLVPLDADTSPEGWSVDPADPTRVRLPAGVCKKLQEKEAFVLRMSTQCDTKTSTLPTCGTWSSVTGAPVTPETSTLHPPGNVTPGNITPGNPGACSATSKSCGGQCVSLTDARFGCDPATCVPCPTDQPFCQNKLCVKSITTPPVGSMPASLVTNGQMQPGIGALLVPPKDANIYWTTLDGLRTVSKTGGAPVQLANPPTMSPYQKAGALVQTTDGMLLWFADGKVHWKRGTTGSTEDGSHDVMLNSVTAGVLDDFPAAVLVDNTLVWSWPQQGTIAQMYLAQVEAAPIFELLPQRVGGLWGLTYYPGNGTGPDQKLLFWGDHVKGPLAYAQYPSLLSAATLMAQTTQSLAPPRSLAVNDQFFCGVTEEAASRLVCIKLTDVPMPPPAGQPPSVAAVVANPAVGKIEGLTLDGNQAYVAGDQGVAKVNVSDQTVVSLLKGTRAQFVGVDAGYVYWTEFAVGGQGNLSRIVRLPK